MNTIRHIACYARDVENRLRRDLPHHTPLVVVEAEPDGIAIRACAWFGDKDNVVNTSVAWASCDEVTLREAVDSVDVALRHAVRTDKKE